MANVVENVSLGKPAVGGAIFRAVLDDGVTLPTSVSADLDTDFKCLGYVSEDGVTNSQSNDADEIKAWGGDTVLVLDDENEDDFQFTLIEVLNEDVLKAVYGDDNVTVAAATTTVPKTISVAKNGSEQPECAWVIDMILRGDNPKRIVIPRGKVVEIGEITYKDDEAVGYEITVRGLKDTNGNTHYEYMTVGSVVSGT